MIRCFSRVSLVTGFACHGPGTVKIIFGLGGKAKTSLVAAEEGADFVAKTFLRGMAG